MSEELESYRPILFNMALRRMANRADAEDAVQETMMRAFMYADCKRGPLEPWLKRIIINTCNWAHRYRSAKKRTGTVEILPEIYEFPELRPSSPERILIAKDDLKRVLRYVKRLPKYRALLLAIDGYSYADVALMLGQKPAAVKSDIHRTRARLRGKFKHATQLVRT